MLVTIFKKREKIMEKEKKINETNEINELDNALNEISEQLSSEQKTPLERINDRLAEITAEIKKEKEKKEKLLKDVKNKKEKTNEHNELVATILQYQDEVMSLLILQAQQKDFEELNSNKQRRSYFLSNFIKNEMIVRCARNGGAKTYFKVNRDAAKALIGLGFLVEDGSLNFSINPLDKETFKISFKMYSENMKNNVIMYYNNTYDLNIPLNPEKEIYSDEEQYLNNFTATNIINIIRG